ncbi:GntR family transcriptional regulator [Pseudomonas sp. 148P]|uniref:GntR family transcriptional regulator n=1 Tax=Pseudomonas ulcerans TaxID=3115852 RepID=A0ABU7HZV5_9PSED|nr:MULTISPECIES: GntR family transcriptional regulator [unclassified Pseudomonas]MEE1925583.1 GntR family transcriptional regulator [Pseudomonas sp. 147P]MEE1937019.1 GntR family transcriptional regulator [Pseudomonas sp. 148P]
MNYPIENLKHSYLGSGIYGLLREALITGRFQPNDRLRIRDLAEQLGTSVTPVRDAILQLAKEQALVLQTPRDIRVPMLTSSQYLEIRSIRLALEGLAAETAASLATPQQLERLETCIRNNLAAIQDNNLAAALTHNHEFHYALTEIAGMPVLSSLLDGLWMRTGPLIARAYSSFNERIAIDHHWEVLAALKKKDGPAARAAICADILDGSQKMLEYVQLEHD